MIELKGKYSNAKVFTDNVEEGAISQIIQLCNQEFVSGCKIRIMPDTHAGAGCVIGFTADLGDKVIPNIVGVDIGCGMLTISLGNSKIDLQKLDKLINEYIPCGMATHQSRVAKYDEINSLHCIRELKESKRFEKSIGTLGGGNHFIEVDSDDEGNNYLVIHSGSRNLGKQVAEYYQGLAVDLCSGKDKFYEEKDKLITEYKEMGKREQIQKAVEKLLKKYTGLKPKYPKELCFLTGDYRARYLHDMNLCQQYAAINRITMANIILQKMYNRIIEDYEYFQTVHNYINFKDNIIRKGSISAYKDEKVLIPINMRDGSLLCMGKGNEDWNYSAPHGAGRIMSRSKAKELLKLEDYQNSMKGIYTSTVNRSTLDEAPMAYKPMQEIVNNIGDTVEIIKIIKPIYNFKAAE